MEVQGRLFLSVTNVAKYGAPAASVQVQAGQGKKQKQHWGVYAKRVEEVTTEK